MSKLTETVWKVHGSNVQYVVFRLVFVGIECCRVSIKMETSLTVFLTLSVPTFFLLLQMKSNTVRLDFNCKMPVSLMTRKALRICVFYLNECHSQNMCCVNTLKTFWLELKKSFVLTIKSAKTSNLVNYFFRINTQRNYFAWFKILRRECNSHSDSTKTIAQRI